MPCRLSRDVWVEPGVSRRDEVADPRKGVLEGCSGQRHGDFGDRSRFLHLTIEVTEIGFEHPVTVAFPVESSIALVLNPLLFAALVEPLSVFECLSFAFRLLFGFLLPPSCHQQLLVLEDNSLDPIDLVDRDHPGQERLVTKACQGELFEEHLDREQPRCLVVRDHCVSLACCRGEAEFGDRVHDARDLLGESLPGELVFEPADHGTVVELLEEPLPVGAEPTGVLVVGWQSALYLGAFEVVEELFVAVLPHDEAVAVHPVVQVNEVADPLVAQIAVERIFSGVGTADLLEVPLSSCFRQHSRVRSGQEVLGELLVDPMATNRGTNDDGVRHFSRSGIGH